MSHFRDDFCILFLTAHSCSSGRAGSTTSCVSARPSWSSSAKRTFSRTTLTSWTTHAKWCSSWWTSTAQPPDPTTFHGAHRNSERSASALLSAYMLNLLLISSPQYFPHIAAILRGIYWPLKACRDGFL